MLFLPDCLRAQSLVFCLQSQIQTWTYNQPFAFLFLKPSALDWNYTISFSGSLACWLQILGLYLHNSISQFLIINMHTYIYTPIYVYTYETYVHITCILYIHMCVYVYMNVNININFLVVLFHFSGES